MKLRHLFPGFGRRTPDLPALTEHEARVQLGLPLNGDVWDALAISRAVDLCHRRYQLLPDWLQTRRDERRRAQAALADRVARVRGDYILPDVRQDHPGQCPNVDPDGLDGIGRVRVHLVRDDGSPGMRARIDVEPCPLAVDLDPRIETLDLTILPDPVTDPEGFQAALAAAYRTAVETIEPQTFDDVPPETIDQTRRPRTLGVLQAIQAQAGDGLTREQCAEATQWYLDHEADPPAWLQNRHAELNFETRLAAIDADIAGSRARIMAGASTQAAEATLDPDHVHLWDVEDGLGRPGFGCRCGTEKCDLLRCVLEQGHQPPAHGFESDPPGK